MSNRIEVELDDGCIVLPPAARDRLGLQPGTLLVVELAPSGATRLRVQPELPRVVDKDGILVVEGTWAATPEGGEWTDPVRQDRDDRAAELLRRVGV